MKIPELLAPAKNLEYLKNVVDCGADSIYMGYSRYNARMFGSNFSEEEFRAGIAYAHEHGVKVYLTLNTLIKQRNLQDATMLAAQAIRDGVDGILIQDLGLAAIIKALMPHARLHASTQMSVANHFGTDELVDMGFVRVVLARELNTDEVIRIREYAQKNHRIPLEIEAFIQGGLCIAYSGQCFASSFFLGSSSNDGKCLMPCWDNYTLCRDAAVIDSGILIRPKDLCGITEITQLIHGEIDSVKIQGRLRKKEYITEVVRTYRNMLDDFSRDSMTKHALCEYYQRLQSVSPRGLTGGNLAEKISDELIIHTDSKSERISDVTAELQPRNQTNIFCEDDRLTLLTKHKITVVLHKLIPSFSYQTLSPVISRVYIPYRELSLHDNKEAIARICGMFNTYLYMPPMTTERNCEQVYSNIYPLLEQYQLKGAVLSNISDFSLLRDVAANKYTFIAGNHLHVTNCATTEELKKHGIQQATLSLELLPSDARDVSRESHLPLEQIIYGHPDLMHMKYCILKRRTKCGDCTYCSQTRTDHRYSLHGTRCSFEAVLDPEQPGSILFPSTPMNVPRSEWFGSSLRMDFLYETPDTINRIITSVLMKDSDNEMK